MMTIRTDKNEYKLEFGFDAAEDKDIVQKMFDVSSGAYILKKGNNMAEAVLNGTSDMVSDVPTICIDAIYAGCLACNPVTREEAKTISRAYITEKRKKDKNFGYRGLFDEIKQCMEDDGFFVLSGITEMIEEMTSNAEEVLNQTDKELKTE